LTGTGLVWVGEKLLDAFTPIAIRRRAFLMRRFLKRLDSLNPGPAGRLFLQKRKEVERMLDDLLELSSYAQLYSLIACLIALHRNEYSSKWRNMSSEYIRRFERRFDEIAEYIYRFESRHPQINGAEEELYLMHWLIESRLIPMYVGPSFFLRTSLIGHEARTFKVATFIGNRWAYV
jgi:hypothetical protein